MREKARTVCRLLSFKGKTYFWQRGGVIFSKKLSILRDPQACGQKSDYFPIYYDTPPLNPTPFITEW